MSLFNSWAATARVHPPRSALLNLTTETNRELFCSIAMLQIKVVITLRGYYSPYTFCQTKWLSVLEDIWPKFDNVKWGRSTPCAKKLKEKKKGMSQEERAELITCAPHHD